MAVAMNRFAKGSESYREQKDGIKTARSNTPGNSRTPTPTDDNDNRRKADGGENSGGSKKEIALVKKGRESISRNPGPKVHSGAIHGKGVHKVRWSEKLRGLSIVTNNIVLGGRDEANNKEMLRKYGVTHVLNVSKQLNNYHPDGE